MAKLAPDSQIGPFPYRIVKQLDKGHGNMSDVYVATVGTTPNTVVIKIARTQDKHQQFFHYTLDNEVERLRQLNHPGIVRILPIQTNAGLRNQPYMAQASLPGNPWFMVMEHLKGGSVMDLIQQQKQMDLGLALEITKTVASALDYLHSLQQVHLDIKPENILFRRPLASGQRLEPVLIDFGIARDVGQEGLEARTLHYAPPERILGSNRGGTRPPETLALPHPSMDIYALGVTLYQMVTGQRPFEGRSSKSVSSAIMEGNPTEPAQNRKALPSEVNRLILKMMNKDPQGRPSAYAVAREIESILLQQRLAPQIPAAKTPKSSNRAVRPLFWALVIVALLVILLGGIWTMRTNPSGGVANFAQSWLSAAAGAVSPPLSPSPTPTLNMTPTISIAMAVATATPTTSATATPQMPTSTPVPENTDTATPASTATNSPTVVVFTSTPMQISTATATAMSQSVSTSTAVTDNGSPALTPTESTPLPNPGAGQAPTSTPVAENTDTPTPNPTATNTATPAITSTPSTSSTPLPTRAPAPTKSKTRYVVTLLDPKDGTGGSGVVTFSWSTNVTPEANQGFEVVFWKAGQLPSVSGFGLAEPTTSTSIKANLDRLDDNVNIPLDPGEYQWGVLLVQRSPYKRLEFLAGGNRFQFSRTGGSNAQKTNDH